MNHKDDLQIVLVALITFYAVFIALNFYSIILGPKRKHKKYVSTLIDKRGVRKDLTEDDVKQIFFFDIIEAAKLYPSIFEIEKKNVILKSNLLTIEHLQKSGFTLYGHYVEIVNEENKNMNRINSLNNLLEEL